MGFKDLLTRWPCPCDFYIPFYGKPRQPKSGGNVCTRCDGTGRRDKKEMEKPCLNPDDQCWSRGCNGTGEECAKGKGVGKVPGIKTFIEKYDLREQVKTEWKRLQ